MQKLLILLSFLILAACGGGSHSNTATSTASAKPAPTPQGTPMESIPFEEVKNLFDKCDYIDYLFYNTNFSISQNQKGSIQTAISHIAQSPAIHNPACKAIGRIFYQIEGKSILEADIHFQDGCTYFRFLKDKKYAYGNLMTDDGVLYMNNILTQASQMGNGQ